MTGCGSLHIVSLYCPASGELLETYLSKGSDGGCSNSLTAISRMISLSARAGVPIEAIVDQLYSTGSCSSYAVRKATKKDTSKGACCASAVGFALMDMYAEMQLKIDSDDSSTEVKNTELVVVNNPCPLCGDELKFEGGCHSCMCGWSKCD